MVLDQGNFSRRPSMPIVVGRTRVGEISRGRCSNYQLFYYAVSLRPQQSSKNLEKFKHYHRHLNYSSWKFGVLLRRFGWFITLVKVGSAFALSATTYFTNPRQEKWPPRLFAILLIYLITQMGWGAVQMKPKHWQTVYPFNPPSCKGYFDYVLTLLSLRIAPSYQSQGSMWIRCFDIVKLGW